MILVILRLSLRCTVNIKHLNLLAEKHLVIGPDMQTRAHAYDLACSCTLYPPGKYPRVNRSLIQNQFQSIKHSCDIFSCEKFTINCPYSFRKKMNSKRKTSSCFLKFISPRRLYTIVLLHMNL
jgi:hypothetical protein